MTLQEKYNLCLEFILKWEGGYSDVPQDSGGKTNFGITQVVYSNWLKVQGKPDQEVKNITLDTVRIIYYDNYFSKIPELNTLNLSLLQVLFDTAVNFGVGGMIMFIEEALDLPITGIYVSATKEKFLQNNTANLALKIVDNRITYRYTRCKNNSSQNVFLQGWLNRDNALKEKVLSMQPVVTVNPVIMDVDPDLINFSEKKYIFEVRNLLTGKTRFLKGDGTGKQYVALNINLDRKEIKWFDKMPEAKIATEPVKKQFIDGQKLLSVAVSWIDKEFNPGQTEQCCKFVRHCLDEAGIKVGVTTNPSDGFLPTGEGYANSFAGDDIGQKIQNVNDLIQGDIILFRNTYGNWKEGTITHIGIWIGNDNFVHRPTASKPVVMDSLKNYGHFAEGRRLWQNA